MLYSTLTSIYKQKMSMPTTEELLKVPLEKYIVIGGETAISNYSAMLVNLTGYYIRKRIAYSGDYYLFIVLLQGLTEPILSGKHYNISMQT